MTPKAYQIANRHQRVRSRLKGAGTVTEAIMDAGYNSTGRFYATSAKALGMTPSTYRKGGRNEQLRFAVGDCSLGAILVAASPKGVSAILLGDDPEDLLKDLQDRFPEAELIGGDAAFEKLAAARHRLRGKPCEALRPAARRARHGVPAPRLAGAARHPLGDNGELQRNRRKDRPAASSARRGDRPAAQTRRRSPFPAIASCARTARSPAIAGASRGSARCWRARRAGAARLAPARRSGFNRSEIMTSGQRAAIARGCLPSHCACDCRDGGAAARSGFL